MADGPRCKRRKQANPKRSSDVTNFNNGLEASSDSDDEDKLHIVEEDSLQDTEAGAEGATAKESHKNTTKTTTVLPQNGDCNGVNEVNEEEEVSEEEAEGEKDALVEEILQQGDTAIIYPEAPEEEEQSAAETGGADENGTPDPLLQLHICPYCSRGYKRNASLKEHIKYRHETSDDNYSCSHCSYTFTYRSQLERHMSHHRGSKDESQRHTSSQSSGGSGGTRKFKCTECSKAFKYKHHLKEHLRIHSGEKPYECSNCKKRFSHSGSYSSHISSKKCAAANCPNGVSQSSIKPPLTGSQPAPVAIAPARVILKDKMESKPLQEQIPVTQIKTEPEEEDIKPVIVPPVTSNGVNRATVGATLPQGVAMVVPTLGLVSPISININDLQNVLKVAMDGNVLRQVLGNANGAVAQGKQGIVVQQPQQQIISLPAFVDHDGTTKIIINYSISPTAATTANTQPTNLVVKNSPPVAAAVPIAAAAPIPSKTEQSCATKEEQVEVATDLSIVKAEPEAVAISEPTEEGTVKSQAEPSEQPALAQMPKSNTCLLCDDCPEHLEALHLLQHRKAANGEAVDSAALDPSFADLLSEAGVTLDEPSPADDVLSVLKTSFASNANPSDSELEKISENISIPVNVVQKWFAKMNNGKKAVVEKCEPEDDIPIQAEKTQEETQNSESQTTSSPPLSPNRDLVIVKSEPDDPDAPDSQAEPLDLSLPKSASGELTSENVETPSPKQQRPLNLACLSKGQLEGRTIYVTTPQAGNPVNIVTATQIPTLVAIAGQGGMGACLSAINTTTKQRTILIPQLTYTYAAAAGNAAGNKTVVLNGHKKEKKPESAVKSALPAVEQESDSDISAKKRKLLDAGVYPCDLCSKVFQKGSSLLRHKYEHTGKRPHECIVCKKAFKHKHHLIEHARLHTGIKPYQCDKCGKRFSHSGSYSQHMNHRYSYCKRTGNSSPTNAAETQHGSNNNSGDGADSPVAAQHLDSLNTSERDDSVEEEEEDEEAMCMDDIRVVQVDDGEEQEEMGQEEAEEIAQEEAEEEAEDEAGDEPGQDKTEDGEKESGEVMEIELGEVEDEGSEEKMEENGEVEGKDCDKHIREGSGDGEPTSENAK